MKRWMVAAVLVATVVWLAPAANAAVQTFDVNNGGWKTYSIDGQGYVTGADSAFNSTGGNPGGYISGNVGSDVNNRLYSFEVSGSAVGSLTGQRLTVDYRSTGTVTGPSNPNVRFYIGDTGGTNYFVSLYNWNANTAGIWTTNAVSIDASNFMAWPNYNAGTLTFSQVVANPGWVGLLFSNGDFSSNGNLGFTSTGGATISIDNVGIPNPVPIPGAVWLLGSGLLGLVGLRRKMKR